MSHCYQRLFHSRLKFWHPGEARVPGPWFQNSGTKSANTSRQHLQPWAARRADGAGSGVPVKEGRLDGLFGRVGGIRNVRTACLSEWIGARDRETGRLLGKKSCPLSPHPVHTSPQRQTAYLSLLPHIYLTSTMRGPEHTHPRPSLLGHSSAQTAQGAQQTFGSKGAPHTPFLSEEEVCLE